MGRYVKKGNDGFASVRNSNFADVVLLPYRGVDAPAVVYISR